MKILKFLYEDPLADFPAAQDLEVHQSQTRGDKTRFEVLIDSLIPTTPGAIAACAVSNQCCAFSALNSWRMGTRQLAISRKLATNSRGGDPPYPQQMPRCRVQRLMATDP